MPDIAVKRDAPKAARSPWSLGFYGTPKRREQ